MEEKKEDIEIENEIPESGNKRWPRIKITFLPIILVTTLIRPSSSIFLKLFDNESDELIISSKSVFLMCPFSNKYNKILLTCLESIISAIFYLGKC